MPNTPNFPSAETFVSLTTGYERVHGVAVQWDEGGDEMFVACGSEKRAEDYYTNKVLTRNPVSAELVWRDVLRIYGPWETK